MISPRRTSLSILVILSLLAIPMAAHAVLYSFENISGSTANAATGEAQLHMEVLDSGAGQISFTFTNTGTNPCTITDIYFDDNPPPLFGFDSYGTLTSSEVHYTFIDSVNGKKGFQFTPEYGFDPQSPPVDWGISQGEKLMLVFNYANGIAIDDILAALKNRSLSVGIHVQAFSDQGSAKFTNETTPVPEPTTMLLLGSGLCALALIRARRKPKA